MDLSEIYNFTLTNDELYVIEHIYFSYPTYQVSDLLFLIRKELKNINHAHIVYLGMLIGNDHGTKKTRDEFFNNLKPCQRQN